MNQKGFSLIEVAIGLIILAIGLLSIAGMQMTSIQGNSFSKKLTQATYVIQDRLELLRYLPLSGGVRSIFLTSRSCTDMLDAWLVHCA